MELTVFDECSSQANQTFAVLDKVTDYANKWLNISTDIREYLERNTTERNLDMLRKVRNHGFRVGEFSAAFPGIDELARRPKYLKNELP